MGGGCPSGIVQRLRVALQGRCTTWGRVPAHDTVAMWCHVAWRCHHLQQLQRCGAVWWGGGAASLPLRHECEGRVGGCWLWGCVGQQMCVGVIVWEAGSDRERGGGLKMARRWRVMAGEVGT